MQNKLKFLATKAFGFHYFQNQHRHILSRFEHDL